jgi:hypothetical protein
MANHEVKEDREARQSILKLHISDRSRGGTQKGPRLASYTVKKRTPVNWTEEEVKSLLKGVREYGEGKWSVILQKVPGFNKSRRPSDLKDKFRLIKKDTSYYKHPATDFVHVDENCDIILDSLGEHRVYSEKFPYNAAERIARRLKIGIGSEDIVRVSALHSTDGFYHEYKVKFENGAYRISKIKANCRKVDS